jgi:putative membrane protein
VWYHGPCWGAFGAGWGLWPHGPAFGLLLVAIVGAAVVWLLRSVPSRVGGAENAERSSRCRETLDERYARGDIGRDEYMQKRRDLAT